MNDRERGRGFTGLVGLEMTDEVPAGAGQVGGRGDLLLRLLDLVLAELALAGAPGGADVLSVEGLGDRDECDCRRIAAGPPGRRVDPRPDLREVLCDGLIGGQRMRTVHDPAGAPGPWT